LDITSNLYFLELFLYVNQGDIKVSQTSIRSIIQPFGRHTLSRRIREEAANIAFHRNHQDHINNGEEATYRNSRNELSYIANYSKGLGHRQSGEVRPGSYRSMLRAIDSGEPDDFERIRLGTPLPILPGDPKRRKLVNPQAGLAFDLEGPDAHALTIRPAPRIDGPEAAGEMVELYWMALLRDIPFINNFGADAGINAAADELSGLSDFRGPRDGAGDVTSATIFRGSTPGDLTGPFLSQFLLKGNSDSIVGSRETPGIPLTERDGLIKYGSIFIDQKQKTVLGRPDIGNAADYLTNYNTWLAVQNGVDTSGTNQFDTTRRFIRNMRDLANYVHFDALYEAYLNACIYLLSLEIPNPNAPFPGPSQTQILFDQGNPYRDSRTQEGFGTFGGPHILTLVTEVATRALKAVWFQKWFVHRRLRPEEFGGRIHQERTNRPGGATLAAPRYPFISSEVLDSVALNATVAADGVDGIFARYGTYLLPQAFPEGSPTHPSYGSGHATVAGACVTILKAWFDESFILSDPVEPNANGLGLVSYMGPHRDSLTVGGELNKLASNISTGRNIAGVHYRSDYTEAIKLGESIAIGLLEEQRLTYNENYSFRLTKFDGNAIII